PRCSSSVTTTAHGCCSTRRPTRCGPRSRRRCAAARARRSRSWTTDAAAMPDHPVNDAIRLTDGAFYGADPHRHLKWMRRNAPVYWDERGQVWGITLHADVHAISRDPETWRSSGGIRPDNPAMPYMIDMDDPQHRQRRALVNKGFTPRRV